MCEVEKKKNTSIPRKGRKSNVDIKVMVARFSMMVAQKHLDLNLAAGENENNIHLNNPLMGAGNQPPVSYRQYQYCQGNYSNTLITANNYCIQVKNALSITPLPETNEVIKDSLKRLEEAIERDQVKYKEALDVAIKGDPDEMMIAERGKEYAKEEKKKNAKMKVMKGKKGKKK